MRVRVLRTAQASTLESDYVDADGALLLRSTLTWPPGGADLPSEIRVQSFAEGTEHAHTTQHATFEHVSDAVEPGVFELTLEQGVWVTDLRDGNDVSYAHDSSDPTRAERAREEATKEACSSASRSHAVLRRRPTGS